MMLIHVIFPLLGFFLMVVEGHMEYQNENRVIPTLNENDNYMLDGPNSSLNANFTSPRQYENAEKVEWSLLFSLFTRSKPKGVYIERAKELKGTTFDPNKKTKFITHDWLSSGTEDMAVTMTKGYLKSFDFNVIVMDWSDIAKNQQLLPALLEAPNIADKYAQFISELIQQQRVDPAKVHLVGLGHGALISGLVSYRMNGTTIGRVTALDPPVLALGYSNVKGEGISKKSAKFVDVFHSSAGYFGVPNAIGTVDIFPNGGTIVQPGCPPDVYAICSHRRSSEVFTESLTYIVKPFYAVQCDNRKDFEHDKCNKKDQIVIGENIPTTAKGKYYLKTRSASPYSLGKIV